MLDIARKVIVLAGCAFALSGCEVLRLSILDWRLGLDPKAAQQAVDPEVQKQMDRLFARGAAALAGNDLDATIVAWRQYAAIAPVHLAQTKKVRGYLTLLDRESARRFAKQAAAREKSAPYAQTDRLHVALLPLRNQSPNPATPTTPSFNRAVMAMITADLARVPSLTILEREKIDYLLREMNLVDSGLVDPSTLRAQGQMLGAGTVIAGAVYNESGPAGPGSGRYKINTAVSDVAAGGVIGAQEAEGSQSDFFLLEKRIVYGILETMKIKDVPAAVNTIHTRSWQAYARFATGLKLLDEDRFDEARKAFHAALESDPGFALAQEAFLNTPEKPATLDEIKAELRSGS